MIQCIDLYKKLGKRMVLGGLNLTIPGGEITVVIGRSGEGKTVFLKHLVGLMKPDSGQVLVDNEDAINGGTKVIHHIRNKFGIVFQGGALFDSLSVVQNVAFPLIHKDRMPVRQAEEEAMVMLGQVSLEDQRDKLPAEISGGMAKRVALARALITHPQIILFDEPLAGLDPVTKNNIIDLIGQVHDHYKFTGVVVSHHIQEMFLVATRVAMLDGGRIIITGTPEQVSQSEEPVVRNFLSGGRERQ